MQLDYVPISETDNYKSWTKSNIYYNHTHDVRNILIANNQLISAGVDTKIVFKNIKDKQSHSLIRKYNSMPQKPLVQTCDDFVLLQYQSHLELWKLGETLGDVDLNEKKNGDCLSILRSPKKYLHLKSKNDLHIVCSSLGSHPNNKKTNTNHVLWLSYSDLNVIHIYRVEITSKHVLEPEIKIDKIKSLPLACGNRPAVLMKFHLYDETSNLTNGSSSSSVITMPQLRLCYLTNKSCLQCLKLVKDESGFILECSIQCIQQELLLTDNRVYQMTIKGDYVATVDTDHNLVIWSLKTQQPIATLPRYERLTACMSFHPKKNILLVCYANRKIIEYDFELNEYTDWSRETSDKFPRQWHKLHTKLLDCYYDSSNCDKIITYDEQYFVVINKTEKMPTDSNAKIFQQQIAIQNSILSTKFNKKSSDVSLESESHMEVDNYDKCAMHISNKYRVKI